MFPTSCLAPAAQTSTSEPPTAVPTADPLLVGEAFLSAHNAHDADAAGALLTEDAMFALPIHVQRHLHTEPIVGKDEITAYLVSDAWAAITIEGSNFQVEGIRVLFNCKIYSNSACIVGDQAEALLYLDS